MKGGYQIIDFQDVNFNVGDSKIIPGAYDSIKNCKEKPILISNVQVEGAKIPSVWANVFVSTGNYSLMYFVSTSYIRRFIVEPNDTVTYLRDRNPDPGASTLSVEEK